MVSSVYYPPESKFWENNGDLPHEWWFTPWYFPFSTKNNGKSHGEPRKSRRCTVGHVHVSAALDGFDDLRKPGLVELNLNIGYNIYIDTYIYIKHNEYIYNIMNIYIYIDGFSLTVRIIQIEGPYFQSNVREFQAAGNPGEPMGLPWMIHHGWDCEITSWLPLITMKHHEIHGINKWDKLSLFIDFQCIFLPIFLGPSPIFVD